MTEENEVLRSVAQAAEFKDGIDLMLSRAKDFPSPLAALLAGIGVQEKARARIDETLYDSWNREVPTGTYDEVVVGSGPHALIYAAVRASRGVKTLILEKSRRAGGAFACSQGHSFWLNSRNRPGPLGLPGEGRGLNVLPGCVLQPSMVGGGEYQTNADLAWVIRMNLAMLAPMVEVYTGAEVISFTDYGDKLYRVEVKDQGSILARRVVWATGLNKPKTFVATSEVKPERLLNFSEFMAKMDTPFPLRGMGTVAVVGAGDSGKTVIEGLLGQGPSTGMSVGELDFPAQIDWYGCKFANQDEWCAANRGRYSRIGKALGTRVTPRGKATFYATPGFQTAQMGSRSYDWIINCTGYERANPLLEEFKRQPFIIGNLEVATRRGADTTEVYTVGPAAGIKVSDAERAQTPVLASIPGNLTSLFRYAPKTAAFANDLPVLT